MRVKAGASGPTVELDKADARLLNDAAALLEAVGKLADQSYLGASNSVLGCAQTYGAKYFDGGGILIDKAKPDAIESSD